MSDPAMTADDIRRALYRHFAGRWAVVFEVTARPEPLDQPTLDAYRRGKISYRELREATPSQRRIDALLVRRTPRPRSTVTRQMHEWMERREAHARGQAPDPGPALFDTPASSSGRRDGDDGGLERLALEIKVSRADYWQDVRNPDKQAPWRELAERHAYVAPAGMIQVSELPGGSGLLEVGGRSGVVWKRRAPRTRAAKPLPTANVLDAFYRCSYAEARARGLSHGAERDGDVEAMRAELHRLRHANELLAGRVDRERAAAEVWKRRYAVLDAPACGTCGKPVRPARKGRRRSYDDLMWEHAPADETVCAALRAQSMTDEQRRYMYAVPGPEPVYEWDDEEPSNTP